MKLLKIITIIFLFSFNINFNAEETQITSVKCKDTLIQLLSNNKIDQITKDIKEIDLSSKILKIKTNYVDCLPLNIEEDLSVQMLYKMFGEPVFFSLNLSNFLSKKIITIENKSSSIEIEKTTLQYLLSVLSYIIFYISVIVVSVMSMFYIYQTMFITKEGFKNADVGKFAFRSLIGLSLVLPVSYFGGFSIIQVLFISLILFGFIIAKILFVVLSLCFIDINQNYDIDKEFERSNIYTTIVSQVKDNVFMHICDISKRETFLNYNSYKIDNKLSKLKQDQYYSCLTGSSFEDVSSYIFTPDQIRTGKRCALQYGFIKEGEEYCGSLVFNYKKKREIADELTLTSKNYQDKLRQIAIDMREIQCKEDPDNSLLKLDKINCMTQDLNGNYLADNKGELIKINKGFTNSNERTDFISKINEEGRIYFTSNIKEKVKKSFEKMVIEKQKINIEKDLDSALSFINKGWMMIGLVFYVNGDTTNDMTEETEMLLNTYYSTFDFKILDNETKKEEYSKVQKLSISTMDGLFQPSGKEKDNFKLIGISDLIRGENIIINNCQSDLSTCSTVSPNPFYSIIYQGQKMISESTKISGILNVSKIVVTYVLNQPSLSKLIDIPLSSVTFYMILGFILSVIIPLVPFLILIFYIIFYIRDIFISLISITILCVYYALPSKSEEFAGSEIVIYKLFMKNLLYPSFIVISMCCVFILSSISIALINIIFSYVLSGLGLVMDTTSIMGLINGTLGIFIYTIFVSAMIVASSLSIKYIPETMNTYLNLDVESAEVSNNMKGMIQQTVSNPIKKILPSF